MMSKSCLFFPTLVCLCVASSEISTLEIRTAATGAMTAVPAAAT